MTDDTPHTPGIQAPALPALPRPGEKVPVHLERLAETARGYARGAKTAATQRAHAADWRHYTAWCRRRGLDPEFGPLPPDPQVVGLYLAASASEPPAPGKKPSAVRTIERRLPAIAWNCACARHQARRPRRPRAQRHRRNPRHPRPRTAADTGPNGRSRLFQLVTGRAMRAHFDRQARGAERIAAADRAVADLKVSLQAERNAYAKQQTADRPALTDRHRKRARPRYPFPVIL